MYLTKKADRNHAEPAGNLNIDIGNKRAHSLSESGISADHPRVPDEFPSENSLLICQRFEPRMGNNHREVRRVTYLIRSVNRTSSAILAKTNQELDISEVPFQNGHGFEPTKFHDT